MNRNHAATFFGLAMVASFALLSRQWRHVVADEARLRERARRLIESLQVSSVSISFCLPPCWSHSFYSSRAGISAALVALAALIFLQHLRARQAQFGGGAASLSGALLGSFALLAIFEMSGAKFAERLMTVDTAEEGRFGLWSDTISGISDHLWMGSGFGTFQGIFPIYRSAAANSLLWDKAHNDYLELFLTLGLPMALLVLAAFLLIVGRCLKVCSSVADTPFFLC